MEHLYTNTFQTIAHCNLNTSFNDRCHSDWSKTNLIAVVSLDGIYILKPQLENQRGPFRSQLIRNPTERFVHKPSGNYWPTFENLWHNLNPAQYNEVFLNPALMTNVETLSLDLYPRKFRLAKWSPIINVYPRQCLLATITIDYQLIVQAEKHQSWVVVGNLSQLYDLIWMQLNPTDSESGNVCDDFETIRSNLMSLSFCAICWKQTNVNGPLLLAATTPGDIVIWRTIVITNKTDCSIENMQASGLKDIQFNATLILRTNLPNITSMQLAQGLLIVSTRDGQLVLYDLTMNFQDIEFKKYDAQSVTQAKTLSVLVIPPTATLWLKDNIEVTDFYVQPINEETSRIVLAKSTNICWCIINYKSGTSESPATLSISDSFSAIDGLDPEVSLHQTSATWLRRASGKRAILLANDGSFFQLEFVDDQQDATPDLKAIRTGRVDLSRMVPRGLCTSPNGHLITMISSVFLIYDPSKVREPTRLVVVPALNERAFFISCLSKLLDTNWLSQHRIRSPMDVCDMMDSLRSAFSTMNHDQLAQLRAHLEANGLELDHPKNEQDLVKLKIVLFLLTKLMSTNNTNVQNGTFLMLSGDLSLSDVGNKLSDNILLFTIDHLLAQVFGLRVLSAQEYVDAATKLNQDQLKSLRNIRTWLSTNHDAYRHGIKSRWDCLFETLASQLDSCPQELCPLCKLEVKFSSLDHATCPKTHRFNRCAKSLLIASLASNDQIICSDCQRHYLARSVWPASSVDQLWTCSYCQ